MSEGECRCGTSHVLLCEVVEGRVELSGQAKRSEKGGQVGRTGDGGGVEGGRSRLE